MKRALDATDCSRKRSAAMSKADAEFWEPLKDAAENQGTNRKRGFGRHTDQPRQPIFWHALLAEHVPGMNKDRCVQFFSGAPHRLKRRILEIQSVDATGMRVRIDTPLRLPYVVGDLAKDAIANHHLRAAGLVMIQPDESAVAVFRVEVRPVARQNMGVEVDLHDVVASAVSADFMR